MTSAGIGGGLKENVQAPTLASNTTDFKANTNSALEIPTSQKALLDDENLHIRKYRILTLIGNRLNLQRLIPSGNLATPSVTFRKITEERDELSHSDPSSARQNFHERFNGLFVQKIDWASLGRICKQWMKEPLNVAFFLWISCVVVSGAILFLVMTGMLDGVLTKKSQRNAWFEVNNQILNALFTLMCLYQHPKRFHHLVLLCRWKPKDILTLRKVYCKNGTCKPHEWAHMMVVIVLLHVNCFAQYALCGLNLGFKRSERPATGVGICLSIAIAAPGVALMYSILSPLGKEYEADIEAQDQIPNNGGHRFSGTRLSLEKRFSFVSRNEQNLVEYAPQWRGGLFDLWDNPSVAYLTLFCSFCVFGWNMERLRLGNMYVHIVTFLIFCTAPFWIFNLAAINIDDETVKRALGMVGILLCVFGLLYGGFWRIQMRTRFNLPSNKLFCGKPAVADCMQWLFCCWCSLAQEVRTAEFYDIVDGKFFSRKQTDGRVKPALNSLPHEDRATQFRSMPSTPFGRSPSFSKILLEESKEYSSPDRQLPEVEFSRERKHDFMEAPIPPKIHIEHNCSKRT